MNNIDLETLEAYLDGKLASEELETVLAVRQKAISNFSVDNIRL